MSFDKFKQERPKYYELAIFKREVIVRIENDKIGNLVVD